MPLDGRPRGLLLRGTTVWVLSDLGSDRPAPRAESDTSRWRTDGTTLLTAIDVSTPAAPRLLRELYLSGRVRGSRRDGALLTLAHSEHVRFSVPGDSEREARTRVDGAAPEAWLPQRLDHLRNSDGSWSLEETPLCASWAWYPRSGSLNVVRKGDPGVHAEITDVDGHGGSPRPDLFDHRLPDGRLHTVGQVGDPA